MEALIKLNSKSDFERCLFLQTEITSLKKLLVTQNRVLLEYSYKNQKLKDQNRDLKVNNRKHVLNLRETKKQTIED
jgi:hypothetical protein